MLFQRGLHPNGMSDLQSKNNYDEELRTGEHLMHTVSAWYKVGFEHVSMQTTISG